MKHKMNKQLVKIKYKQDAGMGENGKDHLILNYVVEFEADTYERALFYMTNIMKSCQGVIIHTTIELIENY